MFTGLVISGIILIAALIAFSYWCVYRAGRDIGYEQGRGDRLAERHTARHAKTGPRTSLVRGGSAATPARPARIQPSQWYLPPPGPIRSHTSAADIAPVALGLPGPGKPQAARDSGPGTVALPKAGSIGVFLEQLGVKPRLSLPATTGEMRAITDQWIADMQEREEAHRLESAS